MMDEHPVIIEQCVHPCAQGRQHIAFKQLPPHPCSLNLTIEQVDTSPGYRYGRANITTADGRQLDGEVKDVCHKLYVGMRLRLQYIEKSGSSNSIFYKWPDEHICLEEVSG